MIFLRDTISIALNNIHEVKFQSQWRKREGTSIFCQIIANDGKLIKLSKVDEPEDNLILI